jgi:hypothetical protein
MLSVHPDLWNLTEPFFSAIRIIAGILQRDRPSARSATAPLCCLKVTEKTSTGSLVSRTCACFVDGLRCVWRDAAMSGTAPEEVKRNEPFLLLVHSISAVPGPEGATSSSHIGCRSLGIGPMKAVRP